MEQKIQELTAKIYQEGVEKGESQAKKIIAEAQEKAGGILTDAKTQAEKIIAEARQQAAELKRNTEAEIRLSGTQALSAIKQQLLDLVTAGVVDESMTATLSDPATIREFVALVVQNWKMGNETPRLEVLLPVQKQDELKKAFEKGGSDLLKKGLSLSFSKSLKAGFRIGPQDGTFKISLSDEDFAEFFKEYLRPKTRTWLFGE
jgi:V/A-type H+/Na+-transporting ATPase subunit E